MRRHSRTENSKTEKMAWSHLAALVGSTLDYYGADSGDNTFKVDGIVFKVIEDPDDGYRSYLGSIDYTAESKSIFFKLPIARVRLEEYDTLCNKELDSDYLGVNKGFQLVDIADSHIWLQFGTHNYQDYYPIFVFRHTPKEQENDS